MYPAMCIPAAEENAAEQLDSDVYALVTHPEEYEVRLKCIDAARAVCKWFWSGTASYTAKAGKPSPVAGKACTEIRPPALKVQAQQPQLLPQPQLFPQPQLLPQHMKNSRIRIMNQKLLQSLPHIVSTPYHKM